MSPGRKLATAVVAILGMMAGVHSAWAVSAPYFSPPAQTPVTAPAPEPIAAPAVAANPDDILDLLQNRYLALSDKCRSAVVRINASVLVNPSDTAPTTFVWTGFFINRNGDVITTNAENLHKAMRVWIDFNGVSCLAEVAGYDPVTTVGLLHVAKPPVGFTALDLSESTDLPPEGTMVLAVTSKQGQLPGPSAGMVQGYNTNYGELALPTLHLRVNIPDDGGEGGSPVMDLHGKLVGMIIASLRESRSSLVLPARAALRVQQDMLATKKVTYGRFGFEVETQSSSESAPHLVVKSVDYGGPGLAAGLKVGDVLTSIGSTTLHSDDDLRQAWFYAHPGQDLNVQVERDNTLVQLTLHVTEMPMAAEPMPANPTASVAKPSMAGGVGSGTLPVTTLIEPDTVTPVPIIEKSSK